MLSSPKTEENISVVLAYDRSKMPLFVKLHNEAEALTLIASKQLIVANSVNRKTSKSFCFQSHRSPFSSN